MPFENFVRTGKDKGFVVISERDRDLRPIGLHLPAASSEFRLCEAHFHYLRSDQIVWYLLLITPR